MFIPPPPIMLFMLFMLIPLFSVLPIPAPIMLLMLPAGGAPNAEDAEACLGAPPAGGGGKLKPVGVLVPFAGGGGSENEELWFMAGLCWFMLIFDRLEVMLPKGGAAGEDVG